MTWSRRAVVLSALTLGGLVASGAPLVNPRSRGMPPRVRHLQVAAHPDDDILFMNPDLATGIHNRHSTVGIYLTGGESDLPNPAEYAAQRQEGTRASYARMAGVRNDWTRGTLPIAARLVEVNELRARPEIMLVFLNLPEDNNPTAGRALTRLWKDPRTTVHSLITTTGMVRRPFPYTRADVITVLAAIFEQLRPTTIRMQDGQPDHRYQAQWTGFHNHPDHVIGARFAVAAAEHYMANPRRGAPIFHYRDYNIADAGINLAQPDRLRKKDYFRAYAQHDSQAGLAGAYVNWTERGYYRWQRGGSWAARDRAGRIHAFAVYGPRIMHWTGTEDASWAAPRNLPSPELLRPSLTLIEDGSGGLTLLAQSLDGTRILLKRQLISGAWPPEWTTIGAPRGTQIGTPTGLLDGQGRLLVLTRVTDRGVCVRAVDVEPRWRCLGGQNLRDGVSAALGADGRVNIVAATLDRILYWRERPGGEFTLVQGNFGGLRPVSPPVAVNTGERITIYVRTEGSGEIAEVLDDGRTRLLPNPGGQTPPVAVGAAPLVVRDSGSGVNAWAGEHWVDLGGHVLDHPSVLLDPTGLATIIALGADGRLLLNRQQPAPQGVVFGGWRPASREPRAVP